MQSDTSASDLRMEDELEGFRVVAACLKSLGVTHMFGVVGIPVVEVVLLAKMCYDEIETRCHFSPGGCGCAAGGNRIHWDEE